MRAFLDFYTMRIPGGLPLNILVYHFLLLTCWGYSLWRGGAPERIGATILLIGSILTKAAFSAPVGHLKSMEVGVFIVDIVTLAAFLGLALGAERFWPLWVAALQIIGTAAHLVKLLDPELFWRTYAFMLAIWAYPMILLMIAGTWRHRRRLRRFGFDKSWVPFRK
jgi:hypothetical protein